MNHDGVLWEESMDLLQEDLWPLAKKLQVLGVPCNPESFGVEHVDPVTSLVDHDFDIYWPEAKTAVARKGPFGEFDGIFVIDANGEVEETARAIAARVAN